MRALRRLGGATDVIIDVDGCLTSGLQLVTMDGLKIKAFGLDDRAAIEEWQHAVKVTLITSDMSGATIARAKSWNIPLTEAPAQAAKRLLVISKITGDLRRTVYVGDGYHDVLVLECCGFGIAPADAWPPTARAADAVTTLPGGRRAVAQAMDFTGFYLL
jgi:3-deoxy-D-manno-octulosonate 8-phosphate phosphatase (KDO 8-P phosphatase)